MIEKLMGVPYDNDKEVMRKKHHENRSYGSGHYGEFT